jgi:hypothetical protein
MSDSSTMITYGSQFIKVTDSGVRIQQKQEIMYDIDPSDITIPYDQITGVVLVEPTFWHSGYIEIKAPGNNFSHDGLFELRSPYCLCLSKKQYPFAVEMKKIIEEKMALSKNNIDANNTVNNISSADEIRKYKELLDDDIISQDEFNAKKKELLGL